MEEALKKAKTYKKKIFIIGGANVYKQALAFAEKLYISWVKKDYQGDVYFPEWKKGEWIKESETDHEEFSFTVYKRKNETN